MARLAPLILLCLYAGIVAAKPTVKLLEHAATLYCKLDVLMAGEDEMNLLFEISGSDALHKFEAGRSPTLYYQSENKTVSEAMPLLAPDGNCTQHNTRHASITCLKWKEDLYQLIVVGRADLRFSKGTGYVKWVGGNDPDKKFSEFKLLEVQEANRKTGACMRRELDTSRYKTKTACDRVAGRAALRHGLDSITFYATIRPTHNLSAFWAERKPAYYFLSEDGKTRSEPMPLIQPGGTCTQKRKWSSKKKIESDCTEKSPELYYLRLNVLADKNFSLGLALLEANRKYGWTIWKKDVFLPKVIVKCPAPKIELIAMVPIRSCDPDSKILAHRTDRIWLNLVIHGSDTRFRITGKTGPRLYFATADGEESEPMPLITADGLCTTVTTHDADFSCFKISKKVYSMQVSRKADRKYSMGKAYIKWEQKGRDRKFEEYELPEVKDYCGDSRPKKGKATSGSVGGTRVNIGVVVLGLVVGVLGGLRT